MSHSDFFTTIRQIYKGQTLLRISMNRGFEECVLKGKVVDVGGGRSPDYFEHFKKDGVSSVESIDASFTKIDFEKDPLPYTSSTVGTVVLANVLEHIYNHRFLVGEIYRILEPQGGLVGFVPFFIQYHPDPHDFFRYTKESLRRIFTDAGFGEVMIREVGGGPFSVNYNTIMLSLPRPLRVALFPLYFVADQVFLRFRPQAMTRYPLGFIFELKKL